MHVIVEMANTFLISETSGGAAAHSRFLFIIEFSRALLTVCQRGLVDDKSR